MVGYRGSKRHWEQSPLESRDALPRIKNLAKHVSMFKEKDFDYEVNVDI